MNFRSKEGWILLGITLMFGFLIFYKTQNSVPRLHELIQTKGKLLDKVKGRKKGDLIIDNYDERLYLGGVKKRNKEVFEKLEINQTYTFYHSEQKWVYKIVNQNGKTIDDYNPDLVQKKMIQHISIVMCAFLFLTILAFFNKGVFTSNKKK